MLKSELKYFILLHVNFLIFSAVGVLSKTAANEVFLSFQYLVLLLMIATILIIYAFNWQIVLKHVRLTTAYVSRSVLIIWGFLWGRLLFNETISIKMLLGSFFVLLGVWLVSTERR